MYIEQCFLYQEEDGIRDAQESRWLGDEYKRQVAEEARSAGNKMMWDVVETWLKASGGNVGCILYTSDAADDLFCVYLGGRRIINKNISSYIT